MRNSINLILALFLLLSCTNTEKQLLAEGADKWSEFSAGDTSTIHTEWMVFKEGKDTMTYLTNYYANGKLKSKVLLKGDGVWNIEFVNDTLGKPKQFGKLKNGNGCVTQFNSEDGNPVSAGCYKNGQKEGWWKNFHFKGSVLDSSFYINGYEHVEDSENALTDLMGLFGEMKNNYYE
jgi:hypothetical protein